MNREVQLENLIKSALIKGEGEIVLSNIPLEKAKARLSTKNQRYMNDTKRCLYKLKDSIRKPVAAICCFALMAVLVISFVQPVRVIAQEFVKMIYIAIKGENGKYEAVQIPDDGKYISSRTFARGVNGKELEKTFGHAVFVPEKLEGGYKLKKNNPRVSKYVESGEMRVMACFEKGESQLMLSVQDNNELMKEAKDKGDNGKTRDVDGISLYYCEFPYAIYPFIDDGDGGGTFDITQKPLEIRTIHSFTWEHNGLHYRLCDLTTGDAPAEILESSAKMIIEHQL